jgi:hypothetical protein
MATITRVPVTLTNDESDFICKALADLARRDFEQARKTKSAAVRDYCEREGIKARDLNDSLVKRMYRQIEPDGDFEPGRRLDGGPSHPLCFD